MKVLIVSSTPWDNSNSFGNTFSNLFAGMPNVEIYNVACRNGISNNSVTTKELQMTDKSVLKSILNPFYDPCWEITSSNIPFNSNTEISENARKRRKTIYFIIRDLIWKLGNWKKSKILKSFLEKYKPDILYLPIYATPHMCDIQQYIIKKTKVPVVGHISDDVYNIPPNLSIVGKRYRQHLRKKLNKLIASCDYLEVFAQNMACEYEKIFKKPCHIIGKGVDAQNIPDIDYGYIRKEKINFVYTGNLSTERYDTIVKIAKALERQSIKQVVFNIYSATLLTEEMQKGFEDCAVIKFNGRVSPEAALEAQRDADVLVHVEGFSQKAIFESGMSFSTKIIDYMMSGRLIFAVGSERINSICVLKNKGLGVVATNDEQIESCVENLFGESFNTEAIADRVAGYLRNERDIKVIQKGIRERMEGLVSKIK